MKLLALAAEFVGTFALLTAILFTGNWLAIGLTLSGIILIIGEVSGGHVNPAVSFAMYLKGAISVTELVTYSVAQCAGAASALAVFKAIA
jgi:aquaporin Z